MFDLLLYCFILNAAKMMMMIVKTTPHIHPKLIVMTFHSPESWFLDDELLRSLEPSTLSSSGVDLTLVLESAGVELLAVIPDVLTVGEVVPGDFVSEVTIIPEGSLVEFLEARIAVAVLFSGTTLHSSTTGSM